MKLFYVLFAVLALTLAEEIETNQEIADSVAQASVELLKESRESLEPAASAYNYVPSNTWNNQNNIPQQNRWSNTDTSKNYYVPPQNSYVPPQNNYLPPQNNYVPPQNTYVPPQNTYVPPKNTIAPPQHGYYPTNSWTTPSYTWTTTTQNPIIKNELIYGDNGSYKYEYQLTDGTHVGEHGYFTNPKGTDESLVKKGWYSYPGPDGKIYTVQYYADHTGYHAFGDHLPTPPPVPAAIQAAIDKQEKEQAAQAEAEKNKPVYYPNQPTYYPNQPTYYPNQPTYYPNQPQQTYPQQTNYPTYGK